MTEVDARGQRCPLPVIALAAAARDAPPGSEITLVATDPATCYDVPAWCRMRGHTLLSAPPPPPPPPAPPPAIKELPVDQGIPGRAEAPAELRFVVRVH